MTMPYKIAIAFGMLLLLRLLFYQSKLWQIGRIKRLYLTFLGREKAEDYHELLRQVAPLKQLLEESRVEPGRVPFVRAVGSRHEAVGSTPALENIGLRNEDVAEAMLPAMIKVEGYYRNQRNRVLNPLYWVECIVFLPREVLGYLGVKSESVGVKLSEVAYVGIAGYQIYLAVVGKGSLLDILQALRK